MRVVEQESRVFFDHPQPLGGAVGVGIEDPQGRDSVGSGNFHRFVADVLAANGSR